MISKDYQFHLLYIIAKLFFIKSLAFDFLCLLDKKFLAQNMETMMANIRQISTVAMIKQY